MRRLLTWLLALAMASMLAAWCWALSYRAHPHEPIHNAYWPFTVETSVRDK